MLMRKQLLLTSTLTLMLLVLSVSVLPLNAQDQTSTAADVAVYQLGLVAETLPGSDLTYTITVTNYGPSVVESFYILDGWSVNDEGISAFTLPVAEPDFGDFTLIGAWHQPLSDQELAAWLLQGELIPGATLQFEWSVQVDAAYQGVLVNWVSIQTDGELSGAWESLTATTPAAPPPIESAVDSNTDNNRTSDGVTVVTPTLTHQGLDLTLYQTGTLIELPAGQPVASTWLVANLGPETVTRFYIIAGESPGSSVALSQPDAEPDFGDFQVLGRWQATGQDQDQWLWLLEGDLVPGGIAAFQWERNLASDYRGDLITWAGVAGANVPEGDWIAREGTIGAPAPTGNEADTFPENDLAPQTFTTITG
ncbi:MAG TPA: hypothetical protein VHL11_25695 [Phototrophicaceae bacterium]|nr:hypothetical protein [Phototrophicaceae bacterium]